MGILILVGLALFWTSTTAFGQVAVVGTPTEYKTNPGPYSFSHTTTSDTAVLVCVGAAYGAAITGMTADGAAMTAVSGATGTWDTSGEVEMYIKRSPTVGTITISMTSSAAEGSAGCINFSGADTSSDGNAVQGGASASGTAAGTSVTAGGSPGSNDLVVDGLGWWNTGISSVGADQTSRTGTAYSGSRASMATSTQAGSVSPAAMTWTRTAGVGSWVAVAAFVKAAEATTVPTLGLLGVGK